MNSCIRDCVRLMAVYTECCRLFQVAFSRNGPDF